MNKTIIININGIVFHIEEDAYEVLKNYMTDVKRHFMNSDDSLEITTDIENRIAEMINELLAKENKQVIVEQDVKSVIEQMGTVEDFEHAEEDTKASFSNTYYNTEARRLFRDADDHLLGGVCAGIANYFDIDAVWIRLAFALSVLFAGSGLILYIILWIVIPKAVTRADRMAMKGEKLNLQGFKKNFEEELGSMRDNLSNFRQETRPFVYKARDFVGDFAHHLGVFFNGAGRILLKLIGVFLLLCCFGFIIFIIVVFIGLIGFSSFHPFPGTPFSLIHDRYANPIYISGLIVALIPVISLIVLIFKGIFNTGGVSRSTGSTALVIWICAIGVLVYYSTKVAAEFRSGASYTETINLKPTANNTYYIKLNDIKYFTAEDSARLNIKSLFHNGNIQVNDEDDNRELYHVNLNIERSDANLPVLVESHSARGHNYDDALFNARNAKYIFSQKDSLLTFDYRMRNNGDDMWHGEEVDLTLKLPMNAKVIVDREVDKISNIRVYDCNELNKKDNDKVKSATFMMTDNGLQCKVDTLVIDTIIRKHLPIDSSKKVK